MKRIMVCVDIEKEALDSIKKGYKKIDVADGDSVYLVHGFQIRTYTDLFYVTTMPGEEQYDTIKDSVIRVLKDLKKTIFPHSEKINIKEDCVFSTLIKREMLDYAENRKIDKIIVFTRAKHGFFDSSFAQYMLKNSKCDLEIIRA